MTNRETLEELILRLIAETAEDIYTESKTITFGENLSLVIDLNHESYDMLVTGELYDDGERLVTAFYTSSDNEITCEFDMQIDDEQVNKIINVLSKYLGETI